MPSILIVDDHQDNRDVLGRRLERRGFEIRMAEGGLEAVGSVEADPPDLVLMDLNMPGVDGWQATTRLRELGLTMPVVALTAHAMTGDRDRALAAGCDDYHTKPVDLERLLEQIGALLPDAPAS